jgi:hypothetical protein
MARRKKNKNTRPVRNMITEHEGWSAGDNCYTVFPGESKPAYCELIEFHPMDDVTPSVSVTEVTTGKYRVAAMMAIAETGKEAKKLVPKFNKFLTDWKVEQVALEKKRRRALLKAHKAELEREEAARKAEELEAEEAAIRALKKKKSKKK